MMRGTQFAELSAFVAVADHRNFTKAAAYLGIAPPTLSQAVRSLEDRLGVRLLNRTTRSVALTEAGEHLLTQLHPLLDGFDQALEGVNEFRDKPMGTLRLTVARFAAMSLIGPLVPKFLAEYPAINLEISVNDSNVDIVAEHFDAGIRLGERIEQDMIAIRVGGEFNLVAVASPRYLARRPSPQKPEDLQAHNCIRYRKDWDGSIHRWGFVKAGQRVEVAVEGSLTVNDIAVALNVALDGVGIACLPEGWVAPYIADGRLVRLLDNWSLCLAGFFLYYSSRRQVPPKLQAFIDFIRKQSVQNSREILPAQLA